MPEMNNLSPFVSVIIPIRDDSQRLSICLLSLLKQNYPSDRFEIIVVDNGSSDSIQDVMKKYRETRFYQENSPGSYRARNLGICHAKGCIMAFTDADCIVDREWIAEGVRSLTSQPGAGIVGGKITFFFKSYGKPNAYELYDSSKYMKQKRCIEKSRFCVTANMFAWKYVFDQVGMFDKRLKSGGDSDWGRRVFNRGYDIGYCETAIVYHPARYGFRQLYNKTIRVAEGLSKQEYEKLKPSEMVLRVVSRDLMPPVTKIINIMGKKKYTGAFMKIKMVLLTLIFKYITTFHKIWSYSRN